MYGTRIVPTFEGGMLLTAASNGENDLGRDVYWCSEVTVPPDTRTKYPMLPANRSAGCAVCRRRKVKVCIRSQNIIFILYRRAAPVSDSTWLTRS